MNARFVALSPQDRRLAFENAALGLGLSPVVLEKDFWVSWLLGLLFQERAWAGQLVFKGGTSLSKVFGVIDRFSEDIDLSLQPDRSTAHPNTHCDAVGGHPLRRAVCRLAV